MALRLCSQELTRAGNAQDARYDLSPSRGFVALSKTTFHPRHSTIAVAPANKLREKRVILDEDIFIGSTLWSADEETLFSVVGMNFDEYDNASTYAIRRISRTGTRRAEITRFRTTGVSLQRTDDAVTKLYWTQTGEGGYEWNPTEVDISTGSRRSLGKDIPYVLGPQIHIDARGTVYWVERGTMLLKRTRDGSTTKLYSVGPKARQSKGRVHSIRFDPEGSRMAMMVQYDQKPRATTYILSARGGPPRLLIDDRRADLGRSAFMAPRRKAPS